MLKDTCRTVRKCGKCKLNFRTHCGQFENPREMWRKHTTCPGYLNEALYLDYLGKQAKLAHVMESKLSAVARREEAKLRHTESHHDLRLSAAKK